MLSSLEILGLRGFATKEVLQFAQPTGAPGSGLTVLVGANNSGKSTAIEALRALMQRQDPSFTQGRRNSRAGDRVNLRLTDEGRTTELASVAAGSSETTRVIENGGVDLSRVFVLPSRRTFNPYFGRSTVTREDYMAHVGFPPIRTSSIDQFSYRLFAIQSDPAEFNRVLSEVLDPVPDWTIDQMDTGQYFLKIATGGSAHSSEGLGEGLVSLFLIIDSLYDSKPGDTIAIDEPELSLHPALQRKLASLLTTYSADRQIIVATHSPYFVTLPALEHGSTVARCHLVDGASRISQLSADAAAAVRGLLANLNNPHIFGLNAQEVFFLEDRVVLVEGQEDVVFFSRVQEDLHVMLPGTYFGWGVGGADNMSRIATVLHDLGFSRVVGILDGNRRETAAALNREFPGFHFFAIPANDVRSKPPVRQREGVSGLLDDDNGSVRPEHREETKRLLEVASRYLAPAEDHEPD